MAITDSVAIRQGKTNLAVDAIDAGSGTATGKLVYQTTGLATVATADFANPAFGAANGSALATANAIEDALVTADGTVAKFKVIDRDGTTIFSGTVTAVSGGGDIELTHLDFLEDDIIRTESLTYQSP